MTALTWDAVGERLFETGVDHGVLYVRDANGEYPEGVAWNGLTTVTESPSGAESNKQYADNLVYLNLISVEEFGGTIEAFTYPDEFAACDGTKESNGVLIGQQARETFGLAYRTRVGDDIEGATAGYKIHLVYGAIASPSEKAYATINDSPEALTFSWEFTTTPVPVAGLKPTAVLTIDSTKANASSLAALEQSLFGTVGQDPRLPQPAEVLALFAGTVTEATPTTPSYNGTTKVITIPSIAGVVYKIGGDVVTGTVTITEDTIVYAQPAPGYSFPAVVDTDWLYTF